MLTLIIFIPEFGTNKDVSQVKNDLISYLGTRMVKDKLDSRPALYINGVISQEEKTLITKEFCPTGCIILFLEVEDILDLQGKTLNIINP